MDKDVDLWLPEPLSCTDGDAYVLLQKMGCNIHAFETDRTLVGLPSGWTSYTDESGSEMLCDCKKRIRAVVRAADTLTPGSWPATVLDMMTYYRVNLTIQGVNMGRETHVAGSVQDGYQRPLWEYARTLPYPFGSAVAWVAVDVFARRLHKQLLQLFPGGDDWSAYWDD